MSVTLLIRRPSQIPLEEWRTFVAADPILRLRSEPYCARNPSSGALITIQVGEADAEIEVQGQWLPFLRWRRGQLTTEYDLELENPSNAIRLKLVEIAKALGATVGTDAGDEEIEW